MHLLRYSYSNSSVHDIINAAEEMALMSSDYPCLACAVARSSTAVKLFTGLYLLDPAPSRDIMSKLEALVPDPKIVQPASRDVMWYKTFEGAGDVVRKVSVSGGSIVSGIDGSTGKAGGYKSTSPAPSIISSSTTSTSSITSFLKRSPSQRFRRRFSLVSWNE